MHTVQLSIADRLIHSFMHRYNQCQDTGDTPSTVSLFLFHCRINVAVEMVSVISLQLLTNELVHVQYRENNEQISVQCAVCGVRCAVCGVHCMVLHGSD